MNTQRPIPSEHEIQAMIRAKNKRLAFYMTGLALSLACLAVWFVPLYRILCQQFGMDGSAQDQVSQKKMKSLTEWRNNRFLSYITIVIMYY